MGNPWKDVSPEEAFAEAQRRIAVAKAESWTELDLGDLPLEELPEELGGLRRVHILLLGNQVLGHYPDGKLSWIHRAERPGFRGTDLSQISGMTGLRTLDLAIPDSEIAGLNPLSRLASLRLLTIHAGRLFDISPLSSLHNLSVLDLSWGIQIDDLAPVKHLTSLTSLCLLFCESLVDITPISNLVRLKSLNLFGCKNVEDISPIEGLTNLQTLDLSGMDSVCDFRPLSHLARLRKLELQFCKNLDSLEPMSELNCLKELQLWGADSIRDLSALKNLTQLRRLGIGDCRQVADISPLSELKQLRDLCLSGCTSLNNLHILNELDNLIWLDIRNCGKMSFEAIRTILSRLELLFLSGTEFTDLDSALTGSGFHENVIDKVRSHFADLEFGPAQEAEVKVFVLGNGRIGKTQLVRRLMDDPYDDTIPSTHGIQCRHRTEADLAGWKKVRVNFWDFGGQDIYHGSHALFLHGQAIFVLLWTPDKEQGEYVEAGMTMRNRLLAYWLDYVRTLAGTECPVLVVQSQCDEASCDRIASIPAAHGFESLQEVKFSAKKDRGLEALKGQLREAAKGVLTRYKGWTIGIGRAEVRTKLRDLLEKDQQQTDPAKRKHRVLSHVEYEKVCAGVNKKTPGSVSSSAALLDYLHQTGVVFYKPGLFGDGIVLDQEWALEAIYTLFHRGEVLPHLVRDRGRFTRQLLSDLIWGKRVDGKGPYSVSEQELFLDMMQQCGICFRANRDHDEQHRALEAVYIAPELLPEWRAIRESEYHWTEGRAADAKVVLRYRFLHEGVFRGLVSKIGQQAGEGAHYGKQGCGFFDLKTRTTVMIEALPRETDEHPGAGELVLQAWGGWARELLEMILKEVPRVAVVPPEVECSWEEMGEGMGGEFVSGRTLTPGPSPEGRGEKEQRGEGEKKLDTGLEKLDTVKNRVYLSYAWGEETDDRTKVAEQVIAKLTEWGYEAVYDKQVMGPGDRISEFMKEMAFGHKIVAIISGKYLESRYCMNELHSIYLRALREDQEFLKRVVPVVLEDAKIHAPEDCVVHAKYWNAKHEQLQADERLLGTGHRDWMRKYEEFGRDVSQILYLISDQLSPQNVKELREVDFEAIQRMLERRG